MNIEGRGVYMVTTLSVRWLPLSVIYILPEFMLLTVHYLYISIINRNRKHKLNAVSQTSTKSAEH